jgi:hypothetical protein
MLTAFLEYDHTAEPVVFDVDHVGFRFPTG